MAYFTKRHWLNIHHFVHTSEKKKRCSTCLSKETFKLPLLQVAVFYINIYKRHNTLKPAWSYEGLICQRMTSNATILVIFQKFLVEFP